MDNNKIEQYIKRELALGFTLDKIQHVLLKYGYKDRDVLLAMQDVKRSTSIKESIEYFLMFLKRSIRIDIDKSLNKLNLHSETLSKFTAESPLINHLRINIFAIFFALLGFITLILNVVLYDTLTLGWLNFYTATYSFVIALFITASVTYKYAVKHNLAIINYNHGFLMAAGAALVLFFLKLTSIIGFYCGLVIVFLFLLYILREFYKASFLQSIKIITLSYVFSCVAVFVTYFILAIIIVIT